MSNIKQSSRDLLTNWLKSDFKLYKHFVNKLETLMDKYGRDKMANDVATLRSLNEDLRRDCVLEVADNSKLKGEFK